MTLKVGRFAFGNRSGGASPLSRFPSQPKALLTIAARFRSRFSVPTALSADGNAGGYNVTRSAARASNFIDTGGEALGWHGGAGSARPISPPLAAHPFQTIAGDVLTVAIILLFIALPALFGGL